MKNFVNIAWVQLYSTIKVDPGDPSRRHTGDDGVIFQFNIEDQVFHLLALTNNFASNLTTIYALAPCVSDELLGAVNPGVRLVAPWRHIFHADCGRLQPHCRWSGWEAPSTVWAAPISPTYNLEAEIPRLLESLLDPLVALIWAPEIARVLNRVLQGKVLLSSNISSRPGEAFAGIMIKNSGELMR